MENFGKLKNTFNNILSESIVDKDKNKKKIFKQYVKALNESSILKKQFDVYFRIENIIESNQFKASEKIKKIVESLKSFDKSEIIEANAKLSSIIEGFEIESDYDKKELHENISNLIFSDDVDVYVDSLNETVEYAKTNKAKEVNEAYGVPNSILSVISVNRYNEEYSDLSESDKELINVIIESDETVKEELLKDRISECMELVNERLKDANVDLKETLLAAKEKLMNIQYNNESFEKDVVKVLGLKESLSK
jgi:hypothetical protein